MRTLVITILTAGTGTTFNTAKLSGCRQSSRVSLQRLVLFYEIMKLRNHEIAKSVTRILVLRHLINWFRVWKIC